MSNHRLLIVYAHPDDESFGAGGLIAKYVAQGAKVSLVCATDGDMGTIPDAMQGQYDTVRKLRLAELDCAAEKLGFTRVVKLGYKDSGMMGAESTNDPDCLWYQWNHHPDDVTRRVVEAIREIRPQAILTFNKYGGYGHPDHIAIQRATAEAFRLAGDPDYLISGQQPYIPQKLYYSSIPGKLLKLVLFVMKLRRRDVRHVGVNNDIDFEAILDHVEPIHTLVNIADYLVDWDEASACHASQGGGRGFFGRFPMWLRRIVTGQQGFTRVYPIPMQGRVDERDLFENVSADEPVPEQA